MGVIAITRPLAAPDSCAYACMYRRSKVKTMCRFMDSCVCACVAGQKSKLLCLTDAKDNTSMPCFFIVFTSVLSNHGRKRNYERKIFVFPNVDEETGAFIDREENFVYITVIFIYSLPRKKNK